MNLTVTPDSSERERVLQIRIPLGAANGAAGEAAGASFRGLMRAASRGLIGSLYSYGFLGARAEAHPAPHPPHFSFFSFLQ